jgi:hypothetical protein
MTLPPQDSQQYELRRRIVDCRERLRRKRTSAQKSSERAAPAKAPDVPKKEAQRKK